MPIDRGNVRPGATVQRDTDRLVATVQGVANGQVMLSPSGQSTSAHRHAHSIRPKQTLNPVYAHTANLAVPLDEFLGTWSSPGGKVCKHPGVFPVKPMNCPYCGMTIKPE